MGVSEERSEPEQSRSPSLPCTTVVPDGAKGDPNGAAEAAAPGPATTSFLPRDDEVMALRERSPRCSDLRCSGGQGSRVPASASGLIRC